MIYLSNIEDLIPFFSIPPSCQKIIFRPNSDFFSEGNAVCKIRQNQLAIDLEDEELIYNTKAEFPCGERGCSTTFKTIHAYEVHYASFHRMVCTECKKVFPSYAILDVHIQEKHDAYYQTEKAKLKSLYVCLVEGCTELFTSIESRNEHAVKFHNFPRDFKYTQLKLKQDGAEKMDTNEEPVKFATQSRSYKSRVPHSICFGRGSARAFPHKYQNTRAKKAAIKPISQDISMKELKEAL